MATGKGQFQQKHEQKNTFYLLIYGDSDSFQALYLKYLSLDVQKH